jgi:hypothetical protein
MSFLLLAKRKLGTIWHKEVIFGNYFSCYICIKLSWAQLSIERGKQHDLVSVGILLPFAANVRLFLLLLHLYSS